MNTLVTKNNKGELVITSLMIAKEYGKSHKNVIRTIEKYLVDIEGELGRLTFEPSNYLNSQGKLMPMFELSEQMALAITGRFQGKAAAIHQLRIANQFIQMRDFIREKVKQEKVEQPQPKPRRIGLVRNLDDTRPIVAAIINHHDALMDLVDDGIATVTERKRTYYRYRLTEHGRKLGYTTNKNGTIFSPAQ